MDFDRHAVKRQRALSFEEIEEEYQAAQRGRLAVHISDESGDDSSDDESSRGGNGHCLGGGDGGSRDDSDATGFSMREVAPRFAVERVLGRGAFGLVVRALDTMSTVSGPSPFPAEGPPAAPPAGVPVAIKRVRRIFASPEGARRVLHEARLLKALGGHPNVVTLHALLRPAAAGGGHHQRASLSSSAPGASSSPTPGALTAFDTVYFVLEPCASDLFKVLNSSVRLSAAACRSMGRQVLSALAWLHACRVAHCDVKPGNLLVNANGAVKLADFGLSVVVPEAQAAAQGAAQEAAAQRRAAAVRSEEHTVGPAAAEKAPSFRPAAAACDKPRAFSCPRAAAECHYRAPEVLWPAAGCGTSGSGGGCPGLALDVWSFGCVFAELLMASDADEGSGGDASGDANGYASGGGLVCVEARAPVSFPDDSTSEEAGSMPPTPPSPPAAEAAEAGRDGEGAEAAAAAAGVAAVAACCWPAVGPLHPLPLDADGRVEGTHRARPPLLALAAAPPWLAHAEDAFAEAVAAAAAAGTGLSGSDGDGAGAAAGSGSSGGLGISRPPFQRVLLAGRVSCSGVGGGDRAATPAARTSPYTLADDVDGLGGGAGGAMSGGADPRRSVGGLSEDSRLALAILVHVLGPEGAAGITAGITAGAGVGATADLLSPYARAFVAAALPFAGGAGGAGGLRWRLAGGGAASTTVTSTTASQDSSSGGGGGGGGVDQGGKESSGGKGGFGALRLLADCLRMDPAARPTAAQALAHPCVESTPPLAQTHLSLSLSRARW